MATNPPTPAGSNPQDFDQRARQYQIFRDYLEHEDDLLNHRSTWHLAMQGFLFAAVGVLLQSKSDDSNMDALRMLRQWLPYIIPLVGLSIAILAAFSMSAAHKAINRLSDDWEHVRLEYPTPLPILPALAGAGDTSAKGWGQLPTLGIPIVIALAWTAILVTTSLGSFYVPDKPASKAPAAAASSVNQTCIPCPFPTPRDAAPAAVATPRHQRQ